MNTVIIIGGGASGLMVAWELSKHKIPVTLIEAKQRLGGRIYTLNDPSFSVPIEAGAEFIHGNLQHTVSLLNKAGISYHAIGGEMYQLEKGRFKKENMFTGNWAKLLKQMEELKEDVPLVDFLDKYFTDDSYDELRKSVKDFAGGFDLAETRTASTKALYYEWRKEMDIQYRIDGGYKRLIQYLETECKKNGVVINTGCCAKKINWEKNEVSVLSMCSRFFKGKKVIVTVPVSVLQADINDENYIEFKPSLSQHIQAAKHIGFGGVIKIILEFSENFWEGKTKHAGFIFTKQAVPTWWTQLPVNNAILTGWVGGDKASGLKNETDETILRKTLQSLANAFDVSYKVLKVNLKAFKIANWCKEPDIGGGYSFNTITSGYAKDILRQPVNDTIFFSGEALYEGLPGGTVEAALSSGIKTANQVLMAIQ